MGTTAGTQPSGPGDGILRAPHLIVIPNQWHYPRNEPVAGALVHAMGEAVIVPGHGAVDAVDFLDGSLELVGAKLSAHRVIMVDGTVVELVQEDGVAYHAGVSKDMMGRGGELGRPGLNPCYLGAEWLVEGEWRYASFRAALKSDNAPRFSPDQYRSGAWLYAFWMYRFRFGFSDIRAHSAVAPDLLRGGTGKGKVDPGRGFNWQLFKDLVEEWTIQFNGEDGAT